VRAEGVQIKIEVTPVLRGSVYPAELRAVSSSVEEAFGFTEARVVSFASVSSHASTLLSRFQGGGPLGRDEFARRSSAFRLVSRLACA
jgi:hypothetical protein